MEDPNLFGLRLSAARLAGSDAHTATPGPHKQRQRNCAVRIKRQFCYSNIGGEPMNAKAKTRTLKGGDSKRVCGIGQRRGLSPSA